MTPNLPENRKLKLTGRLHLNHTGMIGRYQFVDGVSVEAIPLNERMRIGANIECIELGADGEELENPSPAYTVLVGSKKRAELRPQLKRQSEGEKAEENAKAVLGSEERKVIYSHEVIEDIAGQFGIAGLREIAGAWNVRSKSIPVLMQMILDAQAAYVAKKRETLLARAVSAEDIEALLKPVTVTPDFRKAPKEVAPAPAAVVTPVAQPEPTPDPVAGDAAQDAVKEAAATGDLAAALNQSTEPKEA